MQCPRIHLNGSGYQNLYRQYSEAVQALHKTLDKLPHPHGRDYYVVGDEAYSYAVREAQDRRQKLQGVLQELQIILQSIQDQEDQRRKICK